MNYTDPSHGRAASVYMFLEGRRSPFLNAGRDCAKHTIPAALPPSNSNGYTKLYKPFQSIGARCVNNLASKLMLGLIAPSRRFFRLVISDKLKKELLPGEASEVELALGQVEQRVMLEMETLGLRPTIFEALRQLVISGNALVFIGKKKARLFDLSQYCVRRDPEGSLLEIVVKETVEPSTLPDSIRESVLAKLRVQRQTPQAQPGVFDDKYVDIYTHVFKEGKRWKHQQEVAGIIIPESVGHYGERKLPWLVLRWTQMDNDDYGRGHCSDFLGDLIAAETLSRSIIRAAAIAAKVVFLVNPNSATDPKDLVEAEEGDFKYGLKSDVEALGLDKLQDFQIAKSTLDEVTSRLAFGFLLNSAARRDAERLTAEEIRFVAQELEDGLGGAFAVLSQELQLPLVEVVMSAMEAEGKLPKLPREDIRPTIITGIDALGRAHELARLDAWIGGALQTFGPQVLVEINMGEYMRRRAAGLDIDPAGLLKTPEEKQAELQQAQQAQMMQAAVPNAVKAIGDNVNAPQQTPQ